MGKAISSSLNQINARCILIAGPTASGKSALALQLARQINAAIVNADSIQFYSGLSILAAQPSGEDREAARHCLYGMVDPAHPYSAGQWLKDLHHLPPDLHNKPIIIVGGSGMYFTALTQGLANIPEISPQFRREWRATATALSTSELWARLERLDPAMAAQLKKSDRQRLTRALEVIMATGRSLDEWQNAPVEPALDCDRVIRVMLSAQRSWLRKRIALRATEMFEKGALQEALALKARKLDPSLPAMKAIGLAEMAALADGQMDKETALGEMAVRTRQYAKRQDTYFRNRMGDWPKFQCDQISCAEISEKILRQIELLW